MNFDLTNDQKMLQDQVRKFAAAELAPVAPEIDKSGEFPWENLKKMAKLGLLGIIVPEEYDVFGLSYTLHCAVIELMARGSLAFSMFFPSQGLNIENIKNYGTEQAKEKYLPDLASGKRIGAMAFSEPDAGSDLQAVKLHAYQDDEGQWFLRGVKRFITNGNGNILLVLARSEAGTKDGRGLSLFVCYGDESVKIRRIENKLGIHGSPTCELQFNDTPAQLIGKRKFGLIK